jgi:SAM-dependent methyltransferase
MTAQTLRLALLAAVAVAALIALNVLVDWLNNNSPTGTLYSAGAGILLFWSLLLLARSQRDRLRAGWDRLAGIAEADAAPLPTQRLLNLFIISFVVLFVETMLIRYIGSQTRIFAFYKNIPLIGAFLGLGIGCYRGQGGRREALLFLVAVAVIGLFFSLVAQSLGAVLGLAAASASSEQVFGFTVAGTPSLAVQVTANLHIGLFCVAVFIALAASFGLLGQMLAANFDGLPRLRAYSTNILGSLAGLAAFVFLSRMNTPPWVWFAVGLVPMLWWLGRGRALRTGLIVIAIAVLAVAPSLHHTVWSTYQKLVGREVPNGYQIDISDAFYQVAFDLSPSGVAKFAENPMPTYDAEYLGVEKLDRVLIVGAGSGNDVAAALRAGAGHVDAVDIDAEIVKLGRLHHPEHPYDDPRVTVIIDDARRAFKSLPAGSYDAVVFGLLDSHTQLAASSVRLDNYVFTQESFSAAAQLLRPGGSLVVSAVTATEWFRDRYANMLARACGAPVAQRDFDIRTVYQCRATAADPDPGATGRAIAAPVDDWPFPYLPARGIPYSYLIVIGMLAIASVYWARRNGIGKVAFSPINLHMFFLGSAFLLMEVYAINRLALLFGTTWLVSAVSIAAMLVEIVAANLVVGLLRFDVRPYAYAGLAILLLAGWHFGPEVVVGSGEIAAFGYALFLLSPVFCAGLVFAASFARAPDPGPALGANIMGAVLGGWSEYATMATGIRFMALIALGLYLASFLFLLASFRKSSMSEMARSEAA